MTEIIEDAVEALREKMSKNSFDGTAKFEIEGEGSIVLNENKVYASDEETDVTFKASVEIFQEIFNPFISFNILVILLCDQIPAG